MTTILRRLSRSRAVLGLSLAVNVLLGAYVATEAVQAMRPRPTGTQALIERMSRGLGAEDQAAFTQAFEQDRPALQAAMDAQRAARRRLNDFIAARPFDAAATRAAMEQWRDAWQRQSSTFGDAFLAALQGISPDGRAQIAARAPGDPAQRPAPPR